MMRFVSNFLIIIIISVLGARESKAISIGDVFSIIGECLMDPCSCGHGSEYEKWGPDTSSNSIAHLTNGLYDYKDSDKFNMWAGFVRNVSKTKKNCPPYNRYSGRKQCLLQFAPPLVLGLEADYSAYCAQASSSSSFDSPKIRFMMQACNFGQCYFFQDDFNAGGSQCRTYPTQYGLPTRRICARVAVPSITMKPDGTLSQQFSPGYQFHYLDTNGFPRPDPGIETAKGRVFLPKICLYEDPSIIESTLPASYAFSYPYDELDTNIHSQPFHADRDKTYNGGVLGLKLGNRSVLNEYFFNTGGRPRGHYDMGMNQAVDFTPIPGQHPNNDTRWREKGEYENWVKNFVYRKKGGSLGCTFLPIGPAPPPFCPTLKKLPLRITSHEICPQEQTYDPGKKKYVLNTRKSTSYDQCVLSDVENNFIKNSFRVSIDDFLPICKDTNDNPYGDSNCVRIHPQGLNILSVHENYRGNLPACSNSSPSDSNPCVLTRFSPNCPAGFKCQNKFRIIYGVKSSRDSSPKMMHGYPTDITNYCSPANTRYPCVEIAGINKGPYNDVSFDFFADPGSINKDFWASLPEFDISSIQTTFRAAPLISYAGPNQTLEVSGPRSIEPNSMCLFYKVPGIASYKKDNCFNRAAPPKLKAMANATSTHLKPTVNVELSYLGAEKGYLVDAIPAAKITALLDTTDLSFSSTSVSQRNIIGYLATSLAVDTKNMINPFYGKYATPEGSATILGDYIDDIKSIKANGTIDTTSKYLRGIEYYNGIYYRGGKSLYVGEVASPRCHTPRKSDSSSSIRFDNTNCVLVKRNYSDLLDCQDFKSSGANFKCPSSLSTSDLTDCTDVRSLTVQTPNPFSTKPNYLNIKSCTSNGVTVTCYETNLEKPVCAASLEKDDRILPAPAEGDGLTDDKYYDFTVPTGYCAKSDSGGALPYDDNKCATRDKTIIETNVSISIPDPAPCAGELTPSESTGFATWPSAKVGEESKGECMEGYVEKPANSLGKRICYQNFNNPPSPVLETRRSEQKCERVQCKGGSIFTSGFKSYGAIWPDAYLGEFSTPTCPPGSIPPADMKRKCEKRADESYQLADLPDDIRCIAGSVNIVDPTFGTLKVSVKPVMNIKMEANTSFSPIIYKLEIGPQKKFQEINSGLPVAWSPLAFFNNGTYEEIFINFDHTGLNLAANKIDISRFDILTNMTSGTIPIYKKDRSFISISPSNITAIGNHTKYHFYTNLLITPRENTTQSQTGFRIVKPLFSGFDGVISISFTLGN